MLRYQLIHRRSRHVFLDMDHSLQSSKIFWPVVGLGLAVSTVLLSQFALDRAADASTIVHWFQHGLLFGGGVGAGLALESIRRAGQGRA